MTSQPTPIYIFFDPALKREPILHSAYLRPTSTTSSDSIRRASQHTFIRRFDSLSPLSKSTQTPSPKPPVSVKKIKQPASSLRLVFTPKQARSLSPTFIAQPSISSLSPPCEVLPPASITSPSHLTYKMGGFEHVDKDYDSIKKIRSKISLTDKDFKSLQQDIANFAAANEERCKVTPRLYAKEIWRKIAGDMVEEEDLDQYWSADRSAFEKGTSLQWPQDKDDITFLCFCILKWEVVALVKKNNKTTGSKDDAATESKSSSSKAKKRKSEAVDDAADDELEEISAPADATKKTKQKQASTSSVPKNKKVKGKAVKDTEAIAASIEGDDQPAAPSNGKTKKVVKGSVSKKAPEKKGDDGKKDGKKDAVESSEVEDITVKHFAIVDMVDMVDNEEDEESSIFGINSTIQKPEWHSPPQRVVSGDEFEDEDSIKKPIWGSPQKFAVVEQKDPENAASKGIVSNGKGKTAAGAGQKKGEAVRKSTVKEKQTRAAADALGNIMAEAEAADAEIKALLEDVKSTVSPEPVVDVTALSSTPTPGKKRETPFREPTQGGPTEATSFTSPVSPLNYGPLPSSINFIVSVGGSGDASPSTLGSGVNTAAEVGTEKAFVLSSSVRFSTFWGAVLCASSSATERALIAAAKKCEVRIPGGAKVNVGIPAKGFACSEEVPVKWAGTMSMAAAAVGKGGVYVGEPVGVILQ